MINFFAFGHENLLGKHRNTFEFTKDKNLSKKGDCIIGVNANFDLKEIREFISKKDLEKPVTIKLKVDDLVEKIKCLLNPNFNSNDEFVVRLSEFISDRTFGIRADKSALFLNRQLINKLKDPKKKIFVEIY